jgi:antitoxin component YwqK of YwqJK toxin-antitoxin module
VPSYAANHEIFVSPPLKGSPSPRRQHARYAVAAKGLSGGIRDRLSLQSRPAVQNGENRSPQGCGGVPEVQGEQNGSAPDRSLFAPPARFAQLSRSESCNPSPGGVTPQSLPAVQKGENDGLNLAGELEDAPGAQAGPVPNVRENPKSGRSPQGCWGVPEVQGEQNGVTPQTLPAVQNGENQPPRLAGELEDPPLVPAKRIVVSSLESYLYFGRLLNGLRQGRGRTAMADGRTAYEGGYRDDMRDGFGVYYYKSGELCYAGEWRRNLRDGLGVAFGAKDGSVFVGNWENGSATGPGSEFDLSGNLTYTGGWKDGRRHGYGTEYRNGRVWRCGVWRDDVFSTDGTPSGHGLP